MPWTLRSVFALVLRQKSLWARHQSHRAAATGLESGQHPRDADGRGSRRRTMRVEARSLCADHTAHSPGYVTRWLWIWLKIRWDSLVRGCGCRIGLHTVSTADCMLCACGLSVSLDILVRTELLPREPGCFSTLSRNCC